MISPYLSYTVRANLLHALLASLKDIIGNIDIHWSSLGRV